MTTPTTHSTHTHRRSISTGAAPAAPLAGAALQIAHGPPAAAARLLRPTPPDTSQTGQPAHVLSPSPPTSDPQLRWLPAEVAVYTRQDGPHASYIAWRNPDGTTSLLALATRRILDIHPPPDPPAAARAIADAAEAHLRRPPIHKPDQPSRPPADHPDQPA